MSMRLVILVVVAGALAVAFAMRSSAPPEPPDKFDTGLSDQELRLVREKQTMLLNRPLPGREPEVPPEFNVEVVVDPTGTKNRLYFYITEAHGYYVEDFALLVWFNSTGFEAGPENSRTFQHYVNKYLKANDTLVDCMELVKPELDSLGGDIGTDRNWGAEVTSHGRAREKNPDPLPIPADDFDRCGTGS